MAMTLGELADLVKGDVVGDPSLRLTGACSAAGAAPDRITFAENPAALEAALASPVGAVIVGRKMAAEGKPLIRADHPRIAFVTILEALHPERRPSPGVHHTAVVERSASLGKDVSVGPHAFIDAEAVVGDGCCVGAGCVVGPGARLGPDCRLYPRVVLYAGVMLGARVVVHSGAVLGSDGFGYADTPEGKRKFPQVGLLIVEDDVEIGANTTIDRGALDATVIRTGTKVDNLVQIAHNVEIGRHCAVSAQTGIAGTSKVGDWVILAGQVGIGDHVTIESRAVVGAQAGVPTGKNLPGGEVYWGTPARPLAEVKERHVDVARIPRLLEAVKDLEARVQALEGRGA